jgi:hypothetical protein
MGNQQSHTKFQSKKHNDSINLPHNEEISNAFQKISEENDLINFYQFQVFFLNKFF